MKAFGVFIEKKENKFFFEQPNNKKQKNKNKTKCHFQGSANSQYFFAKTSEIGPWMWRIDCAKGIDVAQPIWLSGCPT